VIMANSRPGGANARHPASGKLCVLISARFVQVPMQEQVSQLM